MEQSLQTFDAFAHYLDSLIWQPETWVKEFNALLDALEVQFAIEDELSDLMK